MRLVWPLLLAYLPSALAHDIPRDVTVHAFLRPAGERRELLMVAQVQAMFDVLLEYPIHSDRSAFAIRPGFERLAARVVTDLRFLPPGGTVRAYEFVGDPGIVPLDPNWVQAAWRFVELGFSHILDGTD